MIKQIVFYHCFFRSAEQCTASTVIANRIAGKQHFRSPCQVFNPKTTEWQASYDGRNKEPITLPVKFPLLLAQGVEGIAVGLSSKILPHNFNELCDASIAYLRGEEFKLYPDFQTGGSIDVSRYNDA